jgi:branched-chain amino acid transport system permease protein
MNDFLKRNKVTIIIFIPIIIFCYIMSHDSYIGLILSFVVLYAIATSGLDILFGYSGQISFGHAAFFALGAYTSAILSSRYHWPPILGILSGCIVAAFFGIVIAFPASKLVKHFLSLLTIAFGQIVYMFVNSTSSLTGGAGGISGIPPLSFFGLRVVKKSSFFIASIVVLALVLIIKNRLIKSRTGRALIAIRENVHAAQGLGIDIRNYKVLAFAFSAAMSGIAGAFYAHLVGFISPETFNATQSTLFMTMLLFGGIGTLAGPVIGAFVLTIVKEFFQSLSTYQILVYGIFILIVLFFFPNGTVGIFYNAKKFIIKHFAGRKQNATTQ